MKTRQMILSGLLAFSAAAQGADVTDCDRLAAHPSDPDRVAEGLDSADVDTVAAIPACRRAVSEDPGNGRLRYQLGRVLYYEANREGADTAEALAQLKEAANLGHTQAQFVLGLLLKWQGNTCDSEPLTRAAAGQGLKSARLTYVDDYLSGSFADCGAGASREEMAGYLEGAGEQVSGYYEGMLLGALKRQLATAE